MSYLTRFLTAGAALVAAVSFPLVASTGEQDDHEHAEQVERRPVTEVPPAEAVVEINGLVCSFCAFGAEKAVRKLPFLDPARFKDGVEVDINQHQMRLALNPEQPIDYKRLARSLRAAGYEPLDIYLRVQGQLRRRDDGVVLSSLGVDYAVEDAAGAGPGSQDPVELLLRVDGRELHELESGAMVPATLVRAYSS